MCNCPHIAESEPDSLHARHARPHLQAGTQHGALHGQHGELRSGSPRLSSMIPTKIFKKKKEKEKSDKDFFEIKKPDKDSGANPPGAPIHLLKGR